MTDTEPVYALNLDLQQQQSFVRYYRNLPEKTGGTIRFFNRTEFYTVHEEDATYTAQQLFGTHTIKYMGENPKLSYLVISKPNFETYVRELLLIKQYRVEVYVKPAQSKNNEWLLEYKGSPGNLAQFEEILFENNEIVFNTVVMAVKIVQSTMLAVSCVNATESQFYVCEFKDNELFTELEALIAQVNPKECIMPQGDSVELNKISTMLDRSGVLVTKMKKTEFIPDIEQDLNRLLYFQEGQQRNAMALPEYNLTEALGCLQVVIKYLNLSADERNFNLFKMSVFDMNRFVRIDNAAMLALNLFPKPGTRVNANASNKYTSILGVLDKCCTPQGHRLLEQWLKQPLRDLQLISERMEVVEALVKDAETRHILYSNSLTRAPDLLMLAKRLGNKRGTLQDCFRAYQTVSNVLPMIDILRRPNNRSIKALLIDPLSDIMMDMEKYQSMIEQTLDLDLVDRGEFFIKPSFDDELQELNRRKEQIEEGLQKILRSAARDLDLDAGKTIKLENNDQHGYFLRVTLKEEQALRRNKNFRIINAIKGGVRFTNDKLTSLSEEYLEIKNSYEEQQKNVVKEIFEVAAGYTDTLRNLNLCIAKVDVLVSFANVAANAPTPFVRPKLYEEGSGIFRLKKVRHACLELQDGITFIPNDVEFKKDEQLLHVITGPNMGGKSTYIRSIGVAVVLAHIGSLVPCAEAEISLVDSVLARVGASDSQLKGLSTFMLEMVESSSIIKCATSNSLVIIDELGRGTSTHDGCGIAWAIAEHLATKTKCFSLFATHFHELTQLAELVSGVSNLHVTAVTTKDNITPLYQIREGPCDKSYGIHCARMAGFSEDFINIAIKEQDELDYYQGTYNIRNYEPSLKRQIIKDGDEFIGQALKRCKTLDLNSLSDEELLNTVKQIKSELELKNNPFLQGLLNSENPCTQEEPSK